MAMLTSFVIAFAAMLAQQTGCDALKALSLPNTKITTVELVQAGPYRLQGRGGQQSNSPHLPAHCRVAAVLTPSADSHIEMELWLPTENWNGKFLAVGNGGWAGSIDTTAMATSLARGYATASNDTGHKGGSGSFGFGHPERLVDFAYRSMHEMTVQSKAMINAFYKRSPQLSYYNGCSTGGRQGLMEAQRYPDDFDAMIIGAPVYNHIRLHASQMAKQTDMLKDVSKILPPEKQKLINSTVVAMCDAKDGVKDGIISDPESCKFDPASLICSESNKESCLTAAQVETAKRAYSPLKTKKGELVYPGSSPGFETGWRMPQPGGEPPAIALDTFRLAHEDANWNGMNFDLGMDFALAVEKLGYIDAINPDLSKFKARGGKLLMYHGWADPGPAPQNTINYYSAVQQRVGGPSDDWMRLFFLPGVGHCGGGVGPDRADFITALEQWRESGKVPNEIVAARTRNGQTDMTRPLCPYPQIAKWTGTGSTDEAKNFVCAAK
jgi:tannase/feruloyl esterase